MSFALANAIGLGPDSAALAPDPSLARARRILEGYAPRDEAQRETRRRMLDFLRRHRRDAHLRSCLEGHLTASALVVDRAGGRVLLTHHRKLDRWLQLGGHCDGDANLPGVALREAREESGIDDLTVVPEPIDLDVHAIPARPGEPEHLHLDTRFVVLAPPDAVPIPTHESHAVAWLSPGEARRLATDRSLRRLLDLVAGG